MVADEPLELCRYRYLPDDATGANASASRLSLLATRVEPSISRCETPAYRSVMTPPTTSKIRMRRAMMMIVVVLVFMDASLNGLVETQDLVALL
jgi:hypothetical protein